MGTIRTIHKIVTGQPTTDGAGVKLIKDIKKPWVIRLHP